MERELPVFNIRGTDFIVDVEKFELREKEDPFNKISIFNLKDVGDGYILEYCPQLKNTYVPFVNDKPVVVKIPRMNELDPIGMAEKYKQVLEDIKGRTDFEIMVNQKAYDLRVNKNVLPTIKIAGHIFYVDIQMDMLRPKDDLLSKGIVFSDIEKYYDLEKRTYTIPYNPKTHQFEEPDYLNIKEFPKDLIAMRFPSERLLDRIGWNRKYGLEITHGLAMNGLKLKFIAKNIPWEKTFLSKIIKQDINTEKKQKKATEKQQIQPKQSKYKGRRV